MCIPLPDPVIFKCGKDIGEFTIIFWQ